MLHACCVLAVVCIFVFWCPVLNNNRIYDEGLASQFVGFCVLSSFATVSLRKRERKLVALLHVAVSVLRLFLTLLWVGL